MRTRRALTIGAGTLLLVAAQLSLPAPPASAVAGAAGTFTSLPPARILDTRTGNGGFSTPFAPQQTRTLAVLGQGGIPASGVEAVLVNVTTTNATAGGWLTLYPADAAAPLASNLSFGAGQTVANLVVVRVAQTGGNAGRIAITNTGGVTGGPTVDVVADVAGYYVDNTQPVGNKFTGVTPTRILDTRSNTPFGSFGPGQTQDLTVGGVGPVPANADSVVINVTTASPTAAGWLTLFPTGQALPTASNVNFAAAQNVANLVTVKLGTSGKVSIDNTGAGGGTVDVIGDVVGYYLSTSPGVIDPIAPQRTTDTRIGVGGTVGPIAPQATLTVDPHVGGTLVPPVGSYTGVVVNVTATAATTAGWLTVYPSDQSLPTASNLNFAPGQTVANLAKVPVGADGKIKITNTGGSTATPQVQVIVDIVGFYSTGPGTAWNSPTLDGIIQARPLVVGNIVVVATEHDSVYGLSVTDGHIVWGPKSIGTAEPLADIQQLGGPCGNIDPLGVTSNPVYDPATGAVYVVGERETGASSPHPPEHVLASFNPATGAPILNPVSIDGPILAAHAVDNTAVAAQQQRAGLAVANGNVYVGFGGLGGDCGQYHGWVIAARETDGSVVGSFEVAPNTRGGAVWGTAGPAVDSFGVVYASTGNAFNSPATGTDWSDGVLKLGAAAGLLDYFQPTTWRQDNNADADLGSAGPLLVSSGAQIFQIGKQNTAFLLNNGSLGGANHETPAAQVNACSGVVDGGNATIDPAVYIACSSRVREVLINRTSTGPSLSLGWTAPVGATKPVAVGADGVWSVGGNTLYKLYPNDGHVLASDTLALDSSEHFPMPAFGGGDVIIENATHVSAFPA